MDLEKNATKPVFNATHSFQTSDGLKKLEIDIPNEKFVLYQTDKSKRNEYSFSDLIAVEIFENGNSIKRTSKKNYLDKKGGSLKPAYLQNEKSVIYLNLRIEINNASSPVTVLSFLPKNIDKKTQKFIGYKKTDGIYFTAEKDINQWYELLSYIINLKKSSHKKANPSSFEKVIATNEIISKKKKRSRLIDQYKSPIIITLTVLIMIGIISSYSIYTTAREQAIAAYNSEELLIHNIKETEYDSSVKKLIEEYMINNNIKDSIGLEAKFGSEDSNWIKEEYNNAIENLYFENEYPGSYSIELAIEDSKNGESDHSSDAIKAFLNIQKALLTPKLEKEIYITGTGMIEQRIEQTKIAQQAEWDREREEKKIYQVMKNTFNEITNYGESYVPEIHDDIVAKAASETFGITIGEANRIYINGEMGEY